ncbi:hypothetical protein L3X38_031633 [Prunus dulcis]|uniref:Uncharacterized protein n=1 Tax=Prunus dulcis TaxID=3755 RepID=A0AAD4VEQ7_PRUDU|nr:hypothetical protein L3X38_031633 [Prunus dulcis]
MFSRHPLLGLSTLVFIYIQPRRRPLPLDSIESLFFHVESLPSLLSSTLGWSALVIVSTVSKSTTVMVQVASSESAVTMRVAFLTPPSLSDLRSQALPSGEDGCCLEIWHRWLFTYGL